jgi:hypothetical protein
MPALAAADPDRRQHDHRQHHDDVLHDQEAEGDLAVQAVDLALVRQQLDDDDGRRKGQRHRDIKAGDRAEAEGDPDQVAEDRGEGDLTQPGQKRHRPERTDQLHVELDPDEKQQHGDAKLGQQADLFVRPHEVQNRWPGDQPDRDETDDQGLAQDDPDKPRDRRQHQKRRDFSEGRCHDDFHSAPVSSLVSGRGLCLSSARNRPDVQSCRVSTGRAGAYAECRCSEVQAFVIGRPRRRDRRAPKDQG